MKIAAAKIKEMIAAKRITFADQFPEIGARIYGQKERLNYGGDNPKPDPEYGAKLTLSWELDLWGNLRWANEAGIAAYMQSVEAQRSLQLTLVAEVAAAYYELCALDRRLNIVQQTLDARREGVRLAKLRYDGGLTSETSYNQALVELARTETLVPSLERQIRIKESDLSLLLGEYPGYIPRGLSLSEQHLPDALPVGLPSALLERRPDMRQAELKLREANAKVGVAYTDLFPKISLTGNLGAESEELGDLLFAAVKIARFFQIDAEDALAGTCEKFIRRFAGVEAAVTAQGRDMRELDVSQLMALWNREKHPENEERKGNHHEQD